MTAKPVVCVGLFFQLADLYEARLWQSYLASLFDADLISEDKFHQLTDLIRHIRDTSADSDRSAFRIKLRLARYKLTPSDLIPLPSPTTYHLSA